MYGYNRNGLFVSLLGPFFLAQYHIGGKKGREKSSTARELVSLPEDGCAGRDKLILTLYGTKPSEMRVGELLFDSLVSIEPYICMMKPI